MSHTRPETDNASKDHASAPEAMNDYKRAMQEWAFGPNVRRDSEGNVPYSDAVYAQK